MRYPYLARLRDKAVLTDAVRAVMADAGWSDMGFALASGYDEQSGDFVDLSVPIYETQAPGITDNTLLVAPHLAEAQRVRETAKPELPDKPRDDDPNPKPGPIAPIVKPEPPKAVPNARYSGIVELRTSENLVDQLKIIADELLVHLQSASPDTFEVQLTINAGRREGFDTDTARTVSENARNIGFTKNRFEEL